MSRDKIEILTALAVSMALAEDVIYRRGRDLRKGCGKDKKKQRKAERQARKKGRK